MRRGASKKGAKSLLEDDAGENCDAFASPWAREYSEREGEKGAASDSEGDGIEAEVKRLDFEDETVSEKSAATTASSSHRSHTNSERTSHMSRSRKPSKKGLFRADTERMLSDEREEDSSTQQDAEDLSSKMRKNAVDTANELDSSDEEIDSSEVMQGYAAYEVLDAEQQVEVMKRSFSSCHTSYSSRLHLRMLKRFLRMYEAPTKWAARSTDVDTAFSDEELIVLASSFLSHVVDSNIPKELNNASLAWSLRVLAVLLRLPTTFQTLNRRRLAPVERVRKLSEAPSLAPEVALGLGRVLLSVLVALPKENIGEEAAKQLVALVSKIHTRANTCARVVACCCSAWSALTETAPGVGVMTKAGIVELCRDILFVHSADPEANQAGFGLLRRLSSSSDAVQRLITLDGMKTPETKEDAVEISRAVSELFSAAYRLKKHRYCSAEVLKTMTAVLRALPQAPKAFTSTTHIEFAVKELAELSKPRLTAEEEYFLSSLLDHLEAISGSSRVRFQHTFCERHGPNVLMHAIMTLNLQYDDLLSVAFTVLCNMSLIAPGLLSSSLRSGHGAEDLLKAMEKLVEAGQVVSFKAGLSIAVSALANLLKDLDMWSWCQERRRITRVKAIANCSYLESSIATSLIALVEEDQLLYKMD